MKLFSFYILLVPHIRAEVYTYGHNSLHYSTQNFCSFSAKATNSMHYSNYLSNNPLTLEIMLYGST